VGIALVNWQQEEPTDSDGRRQPSRSGTSRISRETYVRFCERLEVKFPGPTRRRQPLFFEFHGPAARLRQDGQFWIASLEGRTEILLTGSANHCIGGPNPVASVISPTADPIGSMQSLLSHFHETENTQLAFQLTYIWATIVSNSKIGEFGSLPRTKGIAIFAGATKCDSAQIQCSRYDGDIDQIVVGSPLFVEQVASVD
jgi:hypothetical protein